MTSLTSATVVMTLSGVPCPSQIRWCLLPVFRRSTGDGQCRLPLLRADVGAVDACSGPVQLAGCVQLGEQDPVQPVEDTGLLPPLQTPPAGLPGAEPEFQGQQLPGDVVAEHVQDALQALPVRHRSRAGSLLGPGRQQRLDQRPQVIVHDPRPGTHTISNGRIVTPVTANQGRSARSCHELEGHRAVIHARRQSCPLPP